MTEKTNNLLPEKMSFKRPAFALNLIEKGSAGFFKVKHCCSNESHYSQQNLVCDVSKGFKN